MKTQGPENGEDSQTVTEVQQSLDGMRYRFSKHGLDSLSISTCQSKINSTAVKRYYKSGKQKKYKGDTHI